MQQAVWVDCPDSYRPERSYVWGILIEVFLGLRLRLSFSAREDTCVTLNDSPRCLNVSDVLFSTCADDWLTSRSLPPRPLSVWRVPPDISNEYAPLESLPVIYGREFETSGLLALSDGNISLGLDVAGSCFFMMTRYEELIDPERDEFGRFSARQSLAYREGFLMRPIVNDYLELLWIVMRRLWPGLKRRPRTFHIEPTHDVDDPFRVRPFGRCLRSAGGDLVDRRSPLAAIRRVCDGVKAACSLPHRDEYDTFDWLMDVSESHNLTSTFNFMASDRYRLKHRPVRNLLRRIHDRGHRIGFHPDLTTFNSFDNIRSEAALLRNILAIEEIEEELGGRQHYLSWDVATTWRLWEKLELDYDSTLGYADHVGFRCGVCYPFPVFDLRLRRQLNLVEKPLLVMDCSLFGRKYMALDHAEAAIVVREIEQRVRLCRGEFVVLWHNSWFNGDQQELDFYQQIVGSGVSTTTATQLRRKTA